MKNTKTIIFLSKMAAPFIILVMLLIALNCNGQSPEFKSHYYIDELVEHSEETNTPVDYFYKHPNYNKTATKLLLYDITSVALNAMGDGYNLIGNQHVGHALNLSSKMVLSWSMLKTDMYGNNLFWVVTKRALGYAALRWVIFDPIINTVIGKPINYVNSNNIWDATRYSINGIGNNRVSLDGMIWSRMLVAAVAGSIYYREFAQGNYRYSFKRFIAGNIKTCNYSNGRLEIQYF